MITLKKLLYLLLIVSLFTSCKQESMLFYPATLPTNYTFHFPNKFQEYNIPVDEKTKLNGLLFLADSSKGLVFYLHGNAGSIDSWGTMANVYLQNNYDLFVLDYRGYGKSEGKIKNEKQLHNDIQIVYDSLKTKYSEDKIVIIGYSIGTGLATKLASTNKPKLLILQAPYYNMIDLAHQYIKIMPSFLIQYKLMSNEYITKVTCPITIFHGNDDEVIYYGSSVKLKQHFKATDKLILLEDQMHNGMNDNKTYQKELYLLLK